MKIELFSFMTKVIWKLVYVANVVDTISNRYIPLSYFMEVYMNLSCNFSKKMRPT